jgi:hypothetical protein
MAPLKAAMLMKTWQGLLQEVDQKVGVVPDLGNTSVGVQRFGPELERRTLCKRQFERFYESAFALSVADKSEQATDKRAQIASLELAGASRGPRCCVYASLASPATMSLVERQSNEWNVLALTVNPTERRLVGIIAAERATLTELGDLAQSAGATLRVLDTVVETLAGDCDQLGLTPREGESPWLKAALWEKTDAKSFNL